MVCFSFVINRGVISRLFTESVIDAVLHPEIRDRMILLRGMCRSLLDLLLFTAARPF
jgi:hypothetical protein